jgi:hypothetical protein
LLSEHRQYKEGVLTCRTFYTTIRSIFQGRSLQKIQQNNPHWQSFFHDGSVIQIEHEQNKVNITLESAEISSAEDSFPNAQLSENRTITGILHLKEVQFILVQNLSFTGQLKMLAEVGEILEMQMTSQKVRLLIEWINFSKKNPEKEISDIVIHAKEIFWENSPNLMSFLEKKT